MRKVLRIDNNGFFIEDVILQDKEITPSNCVEAQCNEGFYKPKWNGSTWMEGLTQTEIDAIKNKPIQPSQLELLQKAVDDLILNGGAV